MIIAMKMSVMMMRRSGMKVKFIKTKFVGLKSMELKRVFLSLLVMGFTVSVMAESDIKIGYVDMQKAIQLTSEGKKAKQDLKKAFNKKAKEIKKKEKDIKKMNEDFEKKKLVLSDEVKQSKADELRIEMMKYEEMVGKSRLELQKKERDLTMPIVKELQSLIEKIAKKENYTVILEKSGQGVLFAKKEVNLTDRLVENFEKAKKAKKK